MRHNYKVDEVFHVFFHRPEGLTYCNKNTNMSWEDNICYSYSSDLGYADFKNKIFYFRSGSRSSNTSKHQWKLRSAIPKDWFVINIDWWNWERNKYNEPFTPKLDKELDATLVRLANNRVTLKSGIKYIGNPDLVEQTIEQVKEILTKSNQFDKFAQWGIKALEYKWTDEELKLYEVKNWANKNEFVGATTKKIKYYNDPILKQLVEDKYAANQSEKQLRELKRKEELAKLEQEKLEKWLKGEYNGYLYNVPIHLRIIKKGVYFNFDDNPDIPQEVETTLGARVPLKHAELLFKKFKQCIDTNTEWYTNGHTIKVGLYQIESISKSLEGVWYLKAGCHIIYDKEIFKFVNDNKLDWYGI